MQHNRDKDCALLSYNCSHGWTKLYKWQCQSTILGTNTGDIPHQFIFRKVKLLVAIFPFIMSLNSILICSLLMEVSTVSVMLYQKKIPRNFMSSNSTIQQVVAFPDFPLEKIRTIRTSKHICFSEQLVCLQLQFNEILKMFGTGCASDLQCHYASLLYCP